MGILQLRDLVPFPSNGNNSTDTVINGVHFNTTALTLNNYTLYSNNTLSNNSNCYLIFGPYQPSILLNGTIINGTDCSSPILPMEARAKLGLAFGALFGLSIVFTLLNLNKHGQQYLHEDKRFRLVGRRWQWYWMLIAAACGMISTLTSIDVDRDYIQGLAIILQGFFFMCLGQATVAIVWEGVRHWGSWQERQVCDRDPFSLPQDDRRGRIEFYMPLAFYFCDFMSFFLTVPRSWSNIPMQGDVAQQNALAKPSATDVRFKVGSIFLAAAWGVILYCVQHNLYYYRIVSHPTRDTSSMRITSVLTVYRYLPFKFFLVILIVAVRIAYDIAISWNFSISVLKYNSNATWIYVFGYVPCMLILIILNLWGYFDKNEDKELIRMRVERGNVADAELGITKKPNWWSKAKGDSHLDDMSRLRGLIDHNNIHSNRRNTDVANTRLGRQSQISRMSRGWSDMELMNLQSPRSPGFHDLSSPGSVLSQFPPSYDDIELTTPYTTKHPEEVEETSIREGRPASSMLCPDSLATPTDQASWLGRSHSPGGASLTSAATGTTLANAQQVKSMLDI